MMAEARISDLEALVAQQREQISTLLERLELNQVAVLAFRDDCSISFDNNQAGRGLYTLKVQQKISGSVRSGHGAPVFTRIRGCLSTLGKQERALFDALEGLFPKRPRVPALT
jgi:transposase